MGLREGATLADDLDRRAEENEPNAPPESARGAPRDETVPTGPKAEDEFLSKFDDQEGKDENFEPGSDLSDEPITWKDREDFAKKRAPKQVERESEEEDQPRGTETDRREEGKSEEPAPSERVAIDESLRALRRDGWTSEMLGKFSDEELTAHAAKAIQRQNGIQQKLDERSRNLDPNHRQADGGRGDTPPDAAAPALDAVAQEAEEVFTDMSGDIALGRKAASILRKFAEGLSSAAQPADGATSADGAMLEAILNERARTRLVDTYPQLKSDNGLFDRVARKASTFLEAGLKTGDYGSMGQLAAADAAWQDAARVVLGDPISAKEREERQRARRARDGGQPSRNRPPRKAASQFRNRDQAESAWLQARESGDHAEARRIEAEFPRLAR